MIINFYLKEDSNVGEDSMTITIIKNSEKTSSQIVNAKKLDDLTAIEQQNIKAILDIIEKYRSVQDGSTDLTYGL